MTNPLIPLGQKARAAAQLLTQTTEAKKNAALNTAAKELHAARESILAANAQDVAEATKAGLAENLIDRLKLDDKRLQGVIDGVKAVAALPDPVGRHLETVTRPNGLRIEKRAVPIGVIGIIFESRPNVAVDAAALCIKSGNACILRGGKDSWHSVQAFVEILQNALDAAGLPRDAVQTLPTADRALVGSLLTLDQYVDVIIPRGGKSLIARVREESRVPVFSHLDGICHTYIDRDADAAKAVALTVNAKMRRTSVCGATECLLLHRQIANTIGRDVILSLLQAGCEVRVPRELMGIDPILKQAEPSDYGFEFLGPVIAVAVVDDVKDAAAFVNQYGSQHTDAIVTENSANAAYFMNNLNSAIVLHNASTQFADGGEFGKGSEIGISTGRLHARGPVGLEELTTYQYRVFGNGQTRP